MGKISVIIPVYNRLVHFRALFICLLNQTLKPFEVIIADDGSNENVLDFIGDLIKEADFKIKHIYQKDLGFRKTRALNSAVKNSEGEYLVFIDQDIIFEENLLEIIFNEKEKSKFLTFRGVTTEKNERDEILRMFDLNLPYSKMLDIILKSKRRDESLKMIKKDKLNNFLYSLKLRSRGSKLVGMLYSLSKEDYIKINGYDEKYQGWGYEDDDFGNRLYKAGLKSKPIYLENTPLHLWHPFDPTKKKSINEEYYYRRKKETTRKNYRCEYGYYKSKENDEVVVKELLKN